MLGLIVSLIIAGIAGWIAGNIMKSQPLMIGGSPIIGNVLLGIVGGFVGRAMLWLIGFRATGTWPAAAWPRAVAVRRACRRCWWSGRRRCRRPSCRP
jgi:uncharacterized membrane protein YeaQ/YmgE (transglycosylase-associated protein family)